MSLYEPLPDHSSLSRIRTRYGLSVFRRFFDAIVVQCQQAGLDLGLFLAFSPFIAAKKQHQSSTQLSVRG